MEISFTGESADALQVRTAMIQTEIGIHRVMVTPARPTRDIIVEEAVDEINQVVASAAGVSGIMVLPDWAPSFGPVQFDGCSLLVQDDGRYPLSVTLRARQIKGPPARLFRPEVFGVDPSADLDDGLAVSTLERLFLPVANFNHHLGHALDGVNLDDAETVLRALAVLKAQAEIMEFDLQRLIDRFKQSDTRAGTPSLPETIAPKVLH